MPTDPLSRTHVTALRACGFYAGNGLRYGAHHKSMLALQELGYVEQRTRIGQREPRWFLTQIERDILEQIGTGELNE